MAVPALVLVRAAQSALRQWRALPDEERERLADAAGAVRRLGFEIPGDKAPSFRGPGPGVTQQPGARREREEVARELRDAVAVLATSAGSSAVAAKGSSRSGAIAGRLAVAGARRLRLGEGTGPRQRASRRPDHGRRSSSSSSARSARRGAPSMVTCDISLDDGARDRRLIVEQEAPPGARGCLHIHTAVAFAAEVDPGTALRRASHLPLGSLGYMAGDGGEDILSFGVRVPFAFLEAADPATVVGVMADLARLADGLERDLAAAGRPDPS